MPKFATVDNHDDENRRTWVTRVAWLSEQQGFCDGGERAAYWQIVDEMRGRPILDLGVGAGRTITLLRSISEKYVAIDYVPAMVEAARMRHPFADVQVGDARDLGRFPDESFSLVAFSNRGIDAVDREGRRQVLAEARRVLKPGGIFWFSTLNKDGPAPRVRPWSFTWPRGQGRAQSVLIAAHKLRETPRKTINYHLFNQRRSEGDGWLIAPFWPGSYRLLVHYTTLSHQLEELQRAGFGSDCQVFDEDGALVTVGDELKDVNSFNIIARRSAIH